MENSIFEKHYFSGGLPDDQLSNHAINTTLANLSERLKEEVLISDDINIIELVDKIRQLTTYTETCLENVIPQLINVATLNTANSQMTNVQNELNSYISNKNVGHLNNAVNHVDTVKAITSHP